MIPARVFELNDGTALAVFAIIAKHANKEGVCWPSVATICESLGWSRKVVEPAIHRLVEAHVIVKEKRQLNGMDQSNLYRIIANVQVVPSERAVVPTAPMGSSHRTSGTFPQNYELEPIELENNDIYAPNLLNGRIPQVKPKSLPKPKETIMPEDFDLSHERMEYALDKGLSRSEADELFEEMRGWSLARGGKYLDWNAAWQNWVRRRAKELLKTRPAANVWVPSHV